MAATGIPEPRRDHAVAIVRFARHCMYQLSHVVQQLDSQLGPGTSELSMRFGIHSGPVTAGVLRGEKSRFQLFGDTGKALFVVTAYVVPNDTSDSHLLFP